MTNSINKMAGKSSVERCGGSASKAGVRGKRTGKSAAVLLTTTPTAAAAAQRHSPTGSGGRGSPRSPGIGSAQLFAGAKWTEPPSATALPPPPVHWMQHSTSRGPLGARGACKSGDLEAVRVQLKMLLGAQA